MLKNKIDEAFDKSYKPVKATITVTINDQRVMLREGDKIEVEHIQYDEFDENTEIRINGKAAITI